MNNKGQTDEVFKYIFGIIVGAMILIFFIGFAYKMMTSSDVKNDVELVLAIDNDLTAFSVSQSATNTIDYNRKMDLFVNEGMLIPSSLDSGQDTGKIIYSPMELQGKELYTATKSFFMPYKVTNFFYITDKRTFYVIVYDQGSKEFMEEITEGYVSIPSNWDFDVYDQKILSDNLVELTALTQDYEKVRFIYLTEPEINPEGYFVNYDSVVIDSSDEEYDFGRVAFEDGISIYLGKEMLIGAFISENKDAYDYNLEEALGKLASVTKVYYDKAKFISTRLPSCDYAAVKTSLNNYKSYIGVEDSEQTYETYYNSLTEANKNLGGDCPEIF